MAATPAQHHAGPPPPHHPVPAAAAPTQPPGASRVPQNQSRSSQQQQPATTMQSVLRVAPSGVLSNPLLGNRMTCRTAAPMVTSTTAFRQVATMAKKKGVRLIVTVECTESKNEGATPSRYCTQKVRWGRGGSRGGGACVGELERAWGRGGRARPGRNCCDGRRCGGGAVGRGGARQGGVPRQQGRGQRGVRGRGACPAGSADGVLGRLPPCGACAGFGQRSRALVAGIVNDAVVEVDMCVEGASSYDEPPSTHVNRRHTA